MTGAVVPSSNRGLKSPPNPGSGFSLCIDYLTVTASLDDFIGRQPDVYAQDLLRSCIKTESHLELVAKALFAEFVAPFAARGISLESEDVRGYLHGYAHHVRLVAGEQKCGFIGFMGEHQRGTFCIQLTGAGCAHIEAWAQLAAKLQSAFARITRVDVALDDFAGVFDLGDVRTLHDNGLFTTNGRPPALGFAGFEDGSGQTIYVGKNAGNQQLCAYEKGKQLGDPESPWLRLEARFGAKYRAIPLELLTNPAAFFAGHYPAFAHCVEALALRMRTMVERAKSTFVKAMHNARRQYGGLLEVMRRNCRNATEFGEFAELLTKPKLPAWVSLLPAAATALPAGIALFRTGELPA